MNEIKPTTVLPNNVASEKLPSEEEEPPSHSRRWPVWRDVSDDLWDDWRWQSQHAVRTVRQLAQYLSFTREELQMLTQLEKDYKLAIPPYYLSLINPEDPNDPIRLQAVPSVFELENRSGYEMEDPLEEDKDMPVPGLTHRYPDRVLLAITHVCTMYCRFCTRKRKTLVRGGWEAISAADRQMIEYIRQHPEIRDVIISGGDPLTLPVARLRFFLDELKAIRHVDVIRIGTRVPVTLPQRLYDQELIELLASAEKVWIQTHFNHPREVTPEAARVCKALLKAGMPVNNHTVLLKGVNDSLETMRQLMRALLRIKVRPYYLFHCDPVIGAGHFRTSIWKGLEIMEGLRGHLSGLGIPTYVVDGPHGAGKIPLMPNYLVSASDDAVILRNYEGMLIRYQAEDKPPTVRPTSTQGVSALLQGDRSALVPEGTERMRRRALIAHGRWQQSLFAETEKAPRPDSQEPSSCSVARTPSRLDPLVCNSNEANPLPAEEAIPAARTRRRRSRTTLPAPAEIVAS
ncbi:MAG: KamA family radical SAM protein [Gemmatales bacterium]|nr:KamA family radical SAM protein [Gemmatales bacterium]MCS7159106.1 KamA family radical SAM protein [Gemmatales bacterium]MDW8174306.1 KamA family radical SAM protein [Gemmatales bacterium]MDW8224258.1 KamA family radical SAM protein [Gemmatales bacterium]